MENRVIKFIYTIVRENGFAFSSPPFNIRDIELGIAERWLELNHAGDTSKVLHRRLFTGLTDKNGVDIYDRDVLMYIGTNMSSMVVKFENGCFVGYGPFNALPLIDYINASDFQSIEVIGNVFENPELLNP